MGDKLVGSFIFLPIPFKQGNAEFYFLVTFEPTQETYFVQEQWQCMDTLEQAWQLHQFDLKSQI